MNEWFEAIANLGVPCVSMCALAWYVNKINDKVFSIAEQYAGLNAKCIDTMDKVNETLTELIHEMRHGKECQKDEV